MYLRPKLYDLSRGTRIKFVKIFRHLTQDNVSDELGITGENKRRTLTRYEKGERKPSKTRLKIIKYTFGHDKKRMIGMNCYQDIEES